MDELSTQSWDDLPHLVSSTPLDEESIAAYCPASSHILDVGCGYGRTCAILEEMGYRFIYGVDQSDVQLRRARASLKQTMLLRSDARSLPFPGHSFDAVITMGVINCCIHVSDMAAIVRECARVLKLGRYWLVNMYARNDSEYFDRKYKEGLTRYGKIRAFTSESGLAFRHYSLAELLTVTDPYFDLIKCKQQDFLSMNQRRKVMGYSAVFQKPRYLSKFRTSSFSVPDGIRASR